MSISADTSAAPGPASAPPRPHATKGDLTKGDIRAHLIRLSWPMIWGIGAIISFQLVDMYFIGLLGTEALAAVSFTFPVTMAIFSVIMGFGIAMSSVVSRLIGSGDRDTVQRVTTHGLLLVFLIGLGLAGLGLIFMTPLFTALGVPPELMPMVREYMTWWFAGAVFITMPLVGNAAIRAGGDTMTPALIMTLAAVMNAVLDPILIFGLFGAPRLELEGAAIATVIANGLAMIAGLSILYGREKLICTNYLKRCGAFGDSAKRLLFIALPAGLTNAIQPLVNAFIIALLAQSGPAAVAAYGVVSRVEAFVFIVIMGVAVGMGPIIGQNWGAQHYSRVNETLRLAIRFAVAWSLLVAGTLILFAEHIATFFSDDPNVIAVAMLFFWIVPITYMFSNLVNGWASAFNAMGMPQRSFIMIVVKMLCLMLPAVYLGFMLQGIFGLFAAIAVVNILAGVIFHFWCRHTCQKILQEN